MPTVAIHMIRLARRLLIRVPGAGSDKRATPARILGRSLLERCPSAGGASQDGAGYEEPPGRDERQLVHADGDHPRREVVGAEAQREGESGEAADEGTENQEAFGND